MPYPTKDEFIGLLKTRKHSELVDEYLLTGIPYAFDSIPASYDLLKTTLAAEFRSGPDDISVVGSGRIGFSLDPEKYGNPYTPNVSDIDTIVVNSKMFDIAWYQMCSKRSRSILSLEWRVKESLAEHRRNNIYFGYIQPDRLTGAITLSPLWFRTFKGLARIPALAPFDIHGRLYRTWEHVKIHQLYSLDSIVSKLGL
jgi:hypothetical protein